MPVHLFSVHAVQSLLNLAGTNNFDVFYGLSTAGITNKYNSFSRSFGYRQKETVRLNLSLNLGERFFTIQKTVRQHSFPKRPRLYAVFLFVLPVESRLRVSERFFVGE